LKKDVPIVVISLLCSNNSKRTIFAIHNLNARQPHIYNGSKNTLPRQEVPCLLASKQRRTSIKFCLKRRERERLLEQNYTLERAAAPELAFIQYAITGFGLHEEFSMQRTMFAIFFLALAHLGKQSKNMFV
jgi:hypothetical protein